MYKYMYKYVLRYIFLFLKYEKIIIWKELYVDKVCYDI